MKKTKENFFKKIIGLSEQPSRELTKDEINALKSGLLGEKPLLSWQTHSRVYKKRSKIYYVNIAIIVLLLGFIAVLAQEAVVALVILSLGFLAYTLAYVEPPIVENRITKMGLVSGGNGYLWEEFTDFWFSNRSNFRILNIAYNGKLSPPFAVIINPEDEPKIANILSKHLYFRQNYRGNIVDKMADKLVEKIPLE